jgi:hypothetical protein
MVHCHSSQKGSSNHQCSRKLTRLYLKPEKNPQRNGSKISKYLNSPNDSGHPHNKKTSELSSFHPYLMYFFEFASYFMEILKENRIKTNHLNFFFTNTIKNFPPVDCNVPRFLYFVRLKRFLVLFIFIIKNTLKCLANT